MAKKFVERGAKEVERRFYETRLGQLTFDELRIFELNEDRKEKNEEGRTAKPNGSTKKWTERFRCLKGLMKEQLKPFGKHFR